MKMGNICFCFSENGLRILWVEANLSFSTFTEIPDLVLVNTGSLFIMFSKNWITISFALTTEVFFSTHIYFQIRRLSKRVRS